MEKKTSSGEELIGNKTAAYVNSFLCLICFQVVSLPVQCVLWWLTLEIVREAFLQRVHIRVAAEEPGVSQLSRSQSLLCPHKSCAEVLLRLTQRAILNDSEVFCTNRTEGCQKFLPYSRLKGHLAKECQFEIVQCPNEGLGCREKVMRKDVDEHLWKECRHNAVCSCGKPLVKTANPHAKCHEAMRAELEQVQKLTKEREETLEVLKEQQKQLNEQIKQKMDENAKLEEEKKAEAMPLEEKEVRERGTKANGKKKNDVNSLVACPFCSKMVNKMVVDWHMKICYQYSEQDKNATEA